MGQFAPVTVAGLVGLVGVALSVAFDTTGAGLAISAGVGCIAGAVGVAVSNNLNGTSAGPGGYIGACAGGALIGAAGAGLAAAVIK